jgi:excisionase family DNA binding protein
MDFAPAGLVALLALLIPLLALVLSRSRSAWFSRRRSPPAKGRVNILTIEDVADICGVSSRVVRQWIEQGLPVIRLGKVVLIHPEDLAAFFEKHRARDGPGSDSSS